MESWYIPTNACICNIAMKILGEKTQFIRSRADWSIFRQYLDFPSWQQLWLFADKKVSIKEREGMHIIQGEA